MLRLATVATLALLLGAGKGVAHDFWISPEVYRWPAGGTMVANLRVGERFIGFRHGFHPDRFDRFEILTSEGPITVDGGTGDIPALEAPDLPEGLAVIVHQTAARELTWSDWDSFAAFAAHKELGDVAAMQDERGLDRAEVREDYIRYAKSLVAIGHGEGEDRQVGLRAELVALANPYTDDLAGALPVQFWLDGEPRTMARVEVFARRIDDGEASFSAYHTDSNGIVVLAVERGMEYLVSTVALEPVGGAEVEAEWRTLRTSLTFAVPEPESGS